MQSFLFQTNPNKNNSVQKTTTPSPNVNPFFQYVTNNRPLILPQIQKEKNNQTVTSNIAPTQNDGSNQRKNSDSSTDPRKMYMPNKQTEVPQTLNNILKNQSETKPTTENLKQRRSRSRQKKPSKNRENSEDSSIKEKKEEHFHKTKLCPLFDKGQCKKGSQCHFAHGYKELRGLPNFFKTRLCLSFDKGQCKKSSSECKYAHGQKQLRSLRHDAGYSSSVSKFNNDSKVNRNDDGKTKNDGDRRNFDSEKRKGNYDRNDREDKNYKNRKERDSESAHRKDRNRKESYHREESRDRRKNNQKNNEDPLSYKKNIPLNKQYEKFLYGDTNPKATQVNNSLYMVPNLAVYPNPSLAVYPNSSSNYSQDLYTVNQRNPSQLLPSPLNQSKGYMPSQKDYRQNPNKLYSFGDQPSSQSYFEKNTQVQAKVPYNNSRQREGYYQKNPYSQMVYPSSPASNQSYNQQYQSSYKAPSQSYKEASAQSYMVPSQSYKQAPSQSYKAPSEFVSDFSKDSYQNFNKSGFNDQSYRNESRAVFSKDNQFSESSGYAQRNMPSGLPVNQFAGKQQTFYSNDSYYSVPQSKLPENNFIKQSGTNPYPNTYSNNYPKSGVYDLYPALDNTVNQAPKHPYPYEKSRYGGFSNNVPK